MSQEQFFKNVNEVGFAIAGQTAALVPADKKLYALRTSPAPCPAVH
jgi:pyrimidine-nucleoside phosphorylase